MSLHSPLATFILTRNQTLKLLSRLESLLPYSLPLTRRIQWHLRHIRENAEVLLSIIREHGDSPAGASDTEDMNVNGTIDKWLEKDWEANAAPWIAAHIDLSVPGTTQGWVFGSWELPSTTGTPLAEVSSTTLHSNLLQSLFHSIHAHLVPRMSVDPPPSWLWLRDNGKWVTQPFSRSKVLFGTVHEAVRRLIRDQEVARIDARYDKWIFPQEDFKDGNQDCQGNGLPDGYSFGTLNENELQMILDGSPIPRTLSNLKEVVNAGIYFQKAGDTVKDKGELIAYSFLNKDASLGGLMVQPEHRGKGLAGLLSKELFRRQADAFSLHNNVKSDEVKLGREEKEGWFSHSDVGEDNGESARVMEKMGGKRMWKVCWVEVDLDVGQGLKDRARENNRRLDEEIAEKKV